MGRLRLRNGVYYGDYYDPEGRRRQPSLGTGDAKVARARLRDLELGTTSQGAATRPTDLLSASLDYFLDVTHAASPAGTRTSYGQKARHVARLLGEVQIGALTREHVDRYIATRLEEGSHTHSVHKELVVLRGALKAAAERGRYTQRPDTVPKFDAGYEPRRTYLTFEQFCAMAEHLVPAAPPRATPETRERLAARKAQRLFTCLLIAYAGPRRSELKAMRWELHVSRDCRRLVIPRGKTVSRRVAVAAELRPWLEEFGERAGWQGPVVAPWTNVGRDLPLACARAGVPRCTPNDLRRTFASWLVQQRESLFVVARLLGHSSTRMVEMVYGQLSEEVLDAAIDRLPARGAASLAVPLLSSETTAGDCHAGATEIADDRVISQSHQKSSGLLFEPATDDNATDSSYLLVPRDGIEPPTRGFSGSISAPEGTPQPGEAPAESHEREREPA